MSEKFYFGDKIKNPLGEVFVVTVHDRFLQGVYLGGKKGSKLKQGIEYMISIPNLCKKVEIHNHPHTKMFK